MTQVCLKQSEWVAHGSNVNAVALTPYKARLLATGGEDRKIAIWAIGKPQPILKVDGHTSPIESVAFSMSEEYIAAGCRSGTTKVFDLENNRVARSLRGHKTSIRCLNFHGNGDIVITGSADTNIKIWDLRRKGCVYTYKAHSDAISSVQFSPDGRWIASGSVDSTAKLWDVGTSKSLKDFTLHKAEVTTVKFHPNELLLATASMDRTIQFWDLETFKLVSSTSGESHGIRCVAFYSDGQSIFSGAQDSLRVYNWEPEAVCCDAVVTNWGKVDDMVIPFTSPQQLVSVSHDKSVVSVWVTNIEKLKQRGDGVRDVREGVDKQREDAAEPSHGKPPLPTNRTASSSGRQQFKVQYIERPRTGPGQPKDELLNEGEDDGPEADEEERQKIFLSRNTFVRTPPKHVVEQRFIVPTQPVAEKQDLFRDKKEQPKGEESMGLNLQQYMAPVQAAAAGRDTNPDLDEDSLIRKLMKDHSQICSILENRHDNLQLIRNDWDPTNIKGFVEAVIGMGDRAVLVDILIHVLCKKQSFWSLGLCTMILPEMRELVTDSKENYVQCAFTVVKLVMKMFGPVIKENMSMASPSHSVDISREERYEKCLTCHSHLQSLRDVVCSIKSSTESKNRMIRELKNVLSRLD